MNMKLSVFCLWSAAYATRWEWVQGFSSSATTYSTRARQTPSSSCSSLLVSRKEISEGDLLTVKDSNDDEEELWHVEDEDAIFLGDDFSELDVDDDDEDYDEDDSDLLELYMDEDEDEEEDDDDDEDLQTSATKSRWSSLNPRAKEQKRFTRNPRRPTGFKENSKQAQKRRK